MRWIGTWSVMVGVFVVAQACILPTDLADGASCEKNDECKSGVCREGFCSGSKCKTSDSSSCGSGWKCVHSSPDPISGFFGASGSDSCRPLCGNCPGNMYCEKG